MREVAMRKLIAGILVAGLLGATPAFADENVDPQHEIALAIAASAINVVYVPAKIVVAAGGLALGALGAALTGGDTRTAYAVWVPAASGTYIVRPEHLDGVVPLDFFGRDYADRRSTNTLSGEPTMAADAVYRAH